MKAWIALALLGLCGHAHAQSATTAITVDRFFPGVGPATLHALEAGEVTPRLAVSALIGLSYQHAPIRLDNALIGGTFSRPVAEQLSGHFAAEIGVFRRIAVAVGVPITWYQTGARLQMTGIDPAPLQAIAAGDLWFRAKLAFIGNPASPGFHAAFAVSVGAPTGSSANFSGWGGWTVEPRLYIDARYQRFAVVANFSARRFQPERRLFFTNFGDEFGWGIGGTVVIHNRGALQISGIFEIEGHVGPSAGTRPTEFRPGMRIGGRRLSLDVGLGAGVPGEVAAPQLRAFMIFRGLFGT